MQMKSKSIILVSILFLFGGCASHQNFVKKYDSWIGKNITYFIAQKGYPDRTYTLPNNHKVYVYEDSRIVSYPSIGFGFGGLYGNEYGMYGYGSDIEQRVCKLFIETNKKGKIIKWGSRGNACVSD